MTADLSASRSMAVAIVTVIRCCLSMTFCAFSSHGFPEIMVVPTTMVFLGAHYYCSVISHIILLYIVIYE